MPSRTSDRLDVSSNQTSPPGKAALLNGVAETVLAQLHVDSADPDWAGQLREVARRYRALALAHPRVVPLIASSRSLTSTA